MIRGKSPLRISLAGGGTDQTYIFKKYGGATVNFTIDKYCHMSILKRDDPKIIINRSLLSKKEQPLAYETIKFFKPNFGFELTYYKKYSNKCLIYTRHKERCTLYWIPIQIRFKLKNNSRADAFNAKF